jgi:L-threonylcarbamoyladenylate synthase
MDWKTPPFATRLVPARPGSIAEAAELLRGGKLVAFPTETVYGLGANAFDERAVSAIFAVKGRPQFNPLIVHVHDRKEAEKLAVFTPLAGRLADAFWPGGLTLVLQRRDPTRLSLLVSAGLETIALRVPAHPIAQALLDSAGVPIAAPSANRSGRLSPTAAAAVREELDGDVALILDGGPCPAGLESTIIGFEGDGPVLLRPGAVTREAVQSVAGPLGTFADDRVRAPGMLASHYAPRARLRLNAEELRAGEALLAFGPNVPVGADIVCNLSPSGDLQDAAANLFAMLRRLDAQANAIAVMPIPQHGLGEAINDRLARAAAPRD